MAMSGMRVRAALHVHSNWSYDGHWFLEDLAVTFRRLGLQVIMLAEHDRGFNEKRFQSLRAACLKASSANLLLIPGIEYSDPENIVHILVWGNIPFLGSGLRTSELLKQVAERDGVAVLSHPTRKEAWRSFNPMWHQHLSGIEYWNRKTDGCQPSKNATALIAQTQLKAYVGLDFHSSRQLFPLWMDIYIRGILSEIEVLTALRSGSCESRAFGLPLSAISKQPCQSLLQAADSFRRLIAKPYRLIRGEQNHNDTTRPF